MPTTDPVAELDDRYSSPGAAPPSWADVLRELERAEIFWLSTVRRDGRPHVTPLPAVWLDGALHVCTGGEEQKAKNLAIEPRCVRQGRTVQPDALPLLNAADTLSTTTASAIASRASSPHDGVARPHLQTTGEGSVLALYAGTDLFHPGSSDLTTLASRTRGCGWTQAYRRPSTVSSASSIPHSSSRVT